MLLTWLTNHTIFFFFTSTNKCFSEAQQYPTIAIVVEKVPCWRHDSLYKAVCQEMQYQAFCHTVHECGSDQRWAAARNRRRAASDACTHKYITPHISPQMWPCLSRFSQIDVQSQFTVWRRPIKTTKKQQHPFQNTSSCFFPEEWKWWTVEAGAVWCVCVCEGDRGREGRMLICSNSVVSSITVHALKIEHKYGQVWLRQRDIN